MSAEMFAGVDQPDMELKDLVVNDRKWIVPRWLFDHVQRIQESEAKRRRSLTLSAVELRDALEFANPDGPVDPDQLETELSFFYREKAEISTDGEPLVPGWYCYLSEYPEEGCYGPLGEPPAGREVVE